MNGEFIQGDSNEILPQFPAGHFDLAIVDPPYGIVDTWSKNRKDRFHKEGRLHQYQNQAAPGPEYFRELRRVSKNQIIWGWQYFCHQLPEGNNIIIWDKVRDFTKSMMSEAELAWSSYNQPARIYQHQWDGARKGTEHPGGNPHQKIHPHQKPIALYKWILVNYAQLGDRILDTHVGSASSLIACEELGYPYYGIEIDEHYYKKALARLRRHAAQLRIFS